ncbi:MAG: dTMP kinase [Alphaproteobacteria bacterium]|nr:dTMP kinase [Alphaproteobacteria bacterium]
MAKGRFITLEGGEGAGKSTQVTLLVEALARRGIEAIATREVGGCAGAEDIRRLWLGKEHGFWDTMTELMLIMAARREHLVKTIWPALERGAWVISDRFVDSTRAYQGIGQGLGLAVVDEAYRLIAGEFKPDLTFILDLPVESGLARMRARATETDRFEQQDTAFHETLRKAYLDLAAAEPQRFKVVNATATPAEVSQQLDVFLDVLFYTLPA